MIGNTYIKLKILKGKISINTLYIYRGTRKRKNFHKASNEEIYYPKNIKEHHILSQESFEFDEYIFSVWHTLIHSSLPLNTVIHRMGNAPKILCPGMLRTKRVSTLFYIFFQALQNYSRLYQWTNQSELLF